MTSIGIVICVFVGIILLTALITASFFAGLAVARGYERKEKSAIRQALDLQRDQMRRVYDFCTYQQQERKCVSPILHPEFEQRIDEEGRAVVKFGKKEVGK